MAYATYQEVEAGFRTLTTDEIPVCNSLLDEAAIIIDAYNANASADAKNVVSCHMVRRVLGVGADTAPMGATQGSISALGYSQSWTLSNGSTGELYISKIDKKLLGVSNHIGSYSPIQELVPND